MCPWYTGMEQMNPNPSDSNTFKLKYYLLCYFIKQHPTKKDTSWIKTQFANLSIFIWNKKIYLSLVFPLKESITNHGMTFLTGSYLFTFTWCKQVLLWASVHSGHLLTNLAIFSLVYDALIRGVVLTVCKAATEQTYHLWKDLLSSQLCFDVPGAEYSLSCLSS